MKLLLKLFLFTCIPITNLFSVGYKEPDFKIEKVNLTFELDDYHTIVTSELELKRNTDNTSASLVLDGSKLKLVSAKLNGTALTEDEYTVDEKSLTLPNVPNHFFLTIVNEISPIENTSLEGLYKSKDIFCTQNESEGFRKITYFLDRPDVMAKYTTKIIADQNRYPILLSNGNPVESGQLNDGKHYVTYSDPFKKPSYLFALVAGDLDFIEDTFTRKSGKPVSLKIFCEKGLKEKCTYAMQCLKRAMKWDEDRFGLECDLDTYMIVAINDFNSGAMENKGLNIFNSSCILASPLTSTDADFARIEGVIGHEYFHNWTGNRVTLRDWTELNVKEALTVFRDQEFSLDMNSWAAQRLEDVAVLREFQFPEDAGPTAHSIRPTGPIETRNLYSATVYCKGPEVIRMIQTLLGKETFRKGMDKYFELYDGQAVSTHQFVKAMETASGKDLSQFERWYDQKGTPKLKVTSHYNAKKKTYTLEVEQSNPKEGPEALPLHIPLKIGLLDRKGKDIPLQSDILEIKKQKESFVFEQIKNRPILSLNRDFSAPVNIEIDVLTEDNMFLMAYDSNEFNRCDAARNLTLHVVQNLINDYKNGSSLKLPQKYLKAYGLLLKDSSMDAAVKAEALTLPTEGEIGQTQDILDIETNHEVRNWVKKELAKTHENEFRNLYYSLVDNDPYSIESNKVAQRSLKNTCLYFLTSLEKPDYISLACDQFNKANNMTDQLAALRCLNQIDCTERSVALDQFYAQWNSDTLVVNKWLGLQAASPLETTLSEVKKLLNHPAYNAKEPNKNRALFGNFMRNYTLFHAKDGSGYTFMEEQISALDETNPHMAARLATAYRDYARLDPERKKLMKQSLENLLNKEGLSPDTYEVINKSLNQS